MLLCSLVFFIFKTPQVNLRAFKNKKSHFRGILFYNYPPLAPYF
jgi:hypothetical protein